jgi:translation initiation factor IF-1
LIEILLPPAVDKRVYNLRIRAIMQEAKMPELNLPPFREFTFGYDAAETEADKSRELLTRGFVRLPGVIEELLSGDRFVVLGRKGSGKSAIKEHLLLSRDRRRLVRTQSLDDFPYSNLKDIVDPQGAEAAFPTAWSWLLLVNFLQSFESDETGSTYTDEELRNTFRALKEMGFLPSTGLAELLLRSGKKSHWRFEAPGGFVIERSHDSDRDFHVPFFPEKLLSTLTRFKGDCAHFLVLDDLDSVLKHGDEHFHSLIALVEESLRINSAFRRTGIAAKVILLLRTDLFDRLPGSNTNKIRQDYSIRLEWYTPEKAESPLWMVANQRARMKYPELAEVADIYFPATLQGSNRLSVLPAEPVPTKEFLLRRTRFVPRDFVMLLTYIQRHAKGVKVETGEIASGLREYATEYFVHEIRNELNYFDNRDINEFFRAFGRLGNKTFSFSEMEQLIPKRLQSRIPELLDLLFECSALGNWERERTPGVRTYSYNFPNARLNHSEPIVLHPALCLALNIAEVTEGSGFSPGSTRSATKELRGTVTDTFPSYGFIKVGKQKYYYNNRDVNRLGRDNVRLCQGDIVVFVPSPPLQTGKAPQARNVRLIGRP